MQMLQTWEGEGGKEGKNIFLPWGRKEELVTKQVL